MHFEVLNSRRRLKCGIELVKADVIQIKRRPNQVFMFKDVDSFVDAIIGHTSCVVYMGKDSDDSELWKAYYWEPTFDEAKKSYGYGEGNNILPHGSLAILEMESEYDLTWTLESRSKEARMYIDLFRKVSHLAEKIRAVDRESEYADEDMFQYMSADELERVLEEMREAYEGLTKTKRAEV